MDEDSKQLRRILLKSDFQLCLNVVDASQREIIRKRAMARNVQSPAHSFENEVVNVQNFGKLRRHGLQSMFQLDIADHFVRALNGGWFALDVCENVGDFGNVAAHVGFELRHL